MKKIIVLLLLSFSMMLQAEGVEFSPDSQFIQGGMVKGRVLPGSTVMVGKTELKVSDEGVFVFGFGRDNALKEDMTVIHPDGTESIEYLIVSKRDYNIQYVEGVAKKFTQPKPERVLERIRVEVKAVKAARKKHFELLAFNKPFKWPFIGPVTGVFGSQRVYNGSPGRPHYGVDIAGPIGTKVYAPQSGVVTLAYDDMYYSGGTLILDHGYGISSSFLHLSKVLVTVGDKIEQGDLIAEVGAGGRSTGPHLDWRMNWYSRRLDPALIVPSMPVIEKE